MSLALAFEQIALLEFFFFFLSLSLTIDSTTWQRNAGNIWLLRSFVVLGTWIAGRVSATRPAADRVSVGLKLALPRMQPWQTQARAANRFEFDRIDIGLYSQDLPFQDDADA